jgi:hypothetical protein
LQGDLYHRVRGANGTRGQPRTFLRELRITPCTPSPQAATERTSDQSTRPGGAADINSAADLHAGIGALDFHKAGTERGTGIASSTLRRRKLINRCGVV